MVQETQPAHAVSAHVSDMHWNRNDERVGLEVIFPGRQYLKSLSRFDSSMMNGLQAVDSWEICWSILPTGTFL